MHALDCDTTGAGPLLLAGAEAKGLGGAWQGQEKGQRKWQRWGIVGLDHPHRQGAWNSALAPGHSGARRYPIIQSQSLAYSYVYMRETDVQASSTEHICNHVFETGLSRHGSPSDRPFPDFQRASARTWGSSKKTLPPQKRPAFAYLRFWTSRPRLGLAKCLHTAGFPTWLRCPNNLAGVWGRYSAQPIGPEFWPAYDL